MRIGLRHALPIALTVVYVALTAKGDAELRAREQRRVQLEKAAPPGEVFWDIRDGPPPRAIEVETSINLPAEGAAFPPQLLVDLVPITPRERELLSYAVSGVFVAILWYLVGRWCDRRLEILPRIRRKWNPMAYLGFVVVSIGAAVLGLGGLAMYSSHGGMFPFGLVLWAMFGGNVLYHHVRDLRQKADS